MDDINGFHVLAECDSPKGSFSSTSEGWTTFRIRGGQTSESSPSTSNSKQISVDLTNENCEAQDFYLDGNLISTIKPGSTITFTTVEGTHTVQVCAPRTSNCGDLISEYWSISRPLSISRSSSCDNAQDPSSNYPTLYADQNYQCREGPSKAFGHVVDIFQGTSYKIIGRASNGWYAIAIDLNSTSEKSCWIGGGVVSGDLSQVQYYEVQQPSESNGAVPIYDLYSDKVIGYLSCADIASLQWWKHPAGWVSNTRLFGSDNALFYPYDSKYICGWEGGTPPGH